MDFSGRNSGVVLVTGSGSGIGQATALAFAQNGATKFVLLDMNETGLEATASQLRGIEPTVDVKTFSLDISQEKAVVEAISSAYAHFGRLDYVVQCAGMNQRPRAPLHDTEMENFDKVFNVNTRGLYIVQREVVRRMRGQELPDHGQRGSIVNISSNSAVQPTPLLVPYAASKAAVITITQGDAQTYAGEGIRINCICPGVVLTPMNKSSIAAGADFSAIIKDTPSGRAAQPEEIAWSAIFLSHPRSGFIVGHALVQDGGKVLV